jgi:(p)ppGpp synthase/HD superfamily hydrolase
MKKGTMLANMLHIATTAHHGQFDRGGAPYILHPLAVMQMTKSNDEEIQCIALGHDVIEDTKITFQDLNASLKVFGHSLRCRDRPTMNTRRSCSLIVML